MFPTIFKYELSHWLRQPLTYIFSVLLFALGLLTMYGMAAEAEGGVGAEVMNAPYRLHYMSNLMSLLMLFLLPAIMGGSLFRDYKSEMYTVLYSYPITKPAYLLAKFTSAFLIVMLVVLCLGVGFGIAAALPGILPEVITGFHFMTYLRLFGVVVWPNLLLLAIIVFAIVIRTRNNYIGFIAIILLVVFQAVITTVLKGVDQWFWAALLDPTADIAVKYQARDWNLQERNTLDIPVTGVLLYNRLLWGTVAAIIGWWAYRRFGFQQFVASKVQAKTPDTTPAESTSLTAPQPQFRYDGWSNWRTAWRLSSMDLRYILFSWPFIALLLAGLILVFFQQAEMNPLYGFELLPTTGRMLRIPMFIFSLVINLVTFLYAGVLLYRGQLSRMDALVDVTAHPNWVLLLSRLLAILKMQLVLLALVLLGGVAAQLLQGYYRIELWHYAFELYILQFMHFAIWACMAFFVHTLFNNMYLSFIMLFLVPTFFMGLPPLGDYLGILFLKEAILQFNTVPGAIVGFDYSDFTQYGTILPVFAAYKSYWLMLGIVLLLGTILLWKRGLTFSWRERWQKLVARAQGGLGWALLLSVIAFVTMGANLYYQEHYVSKTAYTDADEEWVFVQNEKRYGRYWRFPQPQLTFADLQVDLMPETRDFVVQGLLYFVNETEQAIDTILVNSSFREQTNYKLLNPHQLIIQDSALHQDVWVLDTPLATGDSLALDIIVTNYDNTWLHDNSRVQSNGTFIIQNVLPQLGVRTIFLRNQEKRLANNLPATPPLELTPTDTTLLTNNFAGNDMGQVRYRTVISTSKDQKAFSVGNLIQHWEEDDRRYYLYETEQPIASGIAWMSGRYDRKVAFSASTPIELYHHPEHAHHYDHLLSGLQAGLDYCSKTFSPLQHDTLRLIEYPQTVGTYATLMGNLIPYSEALFLCDVDHHKNDVLDFPFFTSAHEVAHYWWGHKVDPANVKGGQVITEGLADYLAIRATAHEYGEDKALQILEKWEQLYLRGHRRAKQEPPLVQAELGQEHLNYRKASLAFHALSKQLGENKFNAILANFEERYRYAKAPYPTVLDLLDSLQTSLPDEMQYMLKDWFETVTFYDNKITDVKLSPSGDQFELTVKYTLRKYRINEAGAYVYTDQVGEQAPGTVEPATAEPTTTEIASLPLADYTRFAFYGADGQVMDEDKVVLTSTVENEWRVLLEERPSKIVLDPGFQMLERERQDNTWQID